MIVISNSKGIVLAPAHVVDMSLVKGKPSVYARGVVKEDKIDVAEFSVREPWTLVVRTTIDKHYINHKNFNDALDHLITLSLHIDDTCDTNTLERSLRKVHGK